MIHLLILLAVVSIVIAFACGTTTFAASTTSVELRRHNGRPTVFIDGQPQALTMYCPPIGTRRFSDIWPRSIPRFAKQPDLAAFMLGLPQDRPPINLDQWPPADNFLQGDTVTTEPQLQTIEEFEAGPRLALEHAPDAYLIIRYNVFDNPDWLARHPDDQVVNADGERMPKTSLASRRYTELQARYARAIISYAESRPWSDHVIAYTNFHLHEGMHGPALQGWMFDYSPAMTERWRSHLRDKYDNLEALRAAYNDPELTFDTAEVPRSELRQQTLDEAAASLYWQSADANQPLRDYLELLAKLYHENFTLIAQAAYEAAPNKLHLHDAFKVPMLGMTNSGFFHSDVSWPMMHTDNNAASGLMNMASLLKNPNFHGLATPHDYHVRGAGGVCEPEGLTDSAVLRGKLFFGEEDLRTYRQDEKYVPASHQSMHGYIRNFDEFLAVTWRNTATALTRGFHNYYFDINGDYLDEPRMQKAIGRQFQVIRESIHWPHITVPSIAIILDDRASLETNGAGHYHHEAVHREYFTGISRCGLPYRIYTLEDLALDNFPEHRVFYFPNLHHVDDERMALLREKVLRDGNVVVWGPGSGISDGRDISAASASALTGFDFELQPINFPRRVQIFDFDHPITADLPADMIYGSTISYGPVLYPITGRRLGLAWAKNAADVSGLAVESFGQGARTENNADATLGQGDYAAVFTTAVPLPADLWRGIARFAGAHIYSDTNDVLLASDRIVALHSLKSGPRRISLPEPRRVYDLVTGDLIADKTDAITFELNAPQTRAFFLEPLDATEWNRHAK